MFKLFRIFILLLILAGVALGASRQQSRSVEWKYTLPVNIFPVNGDGSAATAAYLRSLVQDDFRPVEGFMKEEAERYGRASNASIQIRLQGELSSQPPMPPQYGNTLQVMLWSLHMRWWAWRNAEVKGPNPQVKLLLLYFDPALTNRVGHSTGLQKGLLGRVNVFATRDMAQQNNVVISHELLHTLGATDKYDPATNLPVFPDGYALPEQMPLFPQRYAEIMAGRTPLSQTAAEIPASLNNTVIGEKTAREINWMQP